MAKIGSGAEIAADPSRAWVTPLGDLCLTTKSNMNESMSHRIQALLAQKPVGEHVTIQGWLRTARHSKDFSFLEVNDGSCLVNLQVVADASLANYSTEVVKLLTGCAIRATGQIVESKGSGQAIEIKASTVELIGTAPEDYPLQKKRHTLEYLRTIAHLRPRTNTFGAVLRVRHAASFAIHDFFNSRGFVYMHTPIITASDCEGAGSMFHVTTLDANKPPRTPTGEVDYSKDFFGKAAHLTVSGQLEGEIGATALTNVYTFGPTFRAENSNTSRHLAEFWMIEPEMAFCDLAGDMKLAEDFLKHVFSYVLKHCAEDMKFFNERIDPTILSTLESIITTPFVHVTYTDAIKIVKDSGQKFEFPVDWGIDMQSEHERYLTEVHFKKPVIVTDYPRDIKAFYMYQNDDNKTVAAMDVLVPKVGEIIGGSQREHRYDKLRARMLEMGLSPESYWWYLDLRKYGSVPHAGFGLGFERLIQFMTGMGNIRDVMPFPRAPGCVEF